MRRKIAPSTITTSGQNLYPNYGIKFQLVDNGNLGSERETG